MSPGDHPSLRVTKYSIDAFMQLLSECSECTEAQVREKLHLGYFESYFRDVNVRTIVSEADYIDLDYLTDYAAYYVRCFHHYRRDCTRLHFFSEDLSQDDFLALLSRAADPAAREDLQAAYKGFIVVRPLPQCVIGRTCLAHYDHAGHRHFPVAQPYTANLSGLELSAHTVPFQEQDQVTAACATSALWSALQITSRLFNHTPMPPVAITQAATTGVPLRSRALPNTDGLTIEQMAHGIRAAGLEPFYIDARDAFVLRSTLYSYLSCGIPVLLVVHLAGSSKNRLDPRPISLGYHAVTVTGYSLQLSDLGDRLVRGPRLVSDHIGKVYAHDDQVGPHARMTLIRDRRAPCLTTSFRGPENVRQVRAYPYALLLPLYHKIRIPQQLVCDLAFNLDRALYSFGVLPGVDEHLCWNVRLLTVNDFKREVASRADLNDTARVEILTTPLPRFLWHAAGNRGNEPALDLVLDATDIASGHFIRLAFSSDPGLLRFIMHLADNEALAATPPGQAIADVAARTKAFVVSE